MIKADNDERAAHPTTCGLISAYIKYASEQMGSQIVGLNVGSGHAIFLVDINIDVSVNEYVMNLKSWTSKWIRGNENTESYWLNGFWLCAVSPEDKEKSTGFIESLNFDYFAHIQSIDNAESYGMAYNSCKKGLTPKISYHIILITSRARLLIPAKYKSLLCDIVSETAQRLGADAIVCGAMRNHVHLLVSMQHDIKISWFLDQLINDIKNIILDNPHLRRMEGMSDDALVHTISPIHMQQEKVNVLDQENVHWHCYPINEMSYIYQKMEIKYVTSLR